MRQKIGFNAAALSLAALLSTGCASAPYTQIQIGYANTHHKKDQGGHVDLLCTRARGGAKIGQDKKQEFRLGVDVCYGKLPNSSSQKTYSINVPVIEIGRAHV